jgi:hypothetical protein
MEGTAKDTNDTFLFSVSLTCATQNNLSESFGSLWRGVYAFRSSLGVAKCARCESESVVALSSRETYATNNHSLQYELVDSVSPSAPQVETRFSHSQKRAFLFLRQLNFESCFVSLHRILSKERRLVW